MHVESIMTETSQFKLAFTAAHYGYYTVDPKEGKKRYPSSSNDGMRQSYITKTPLMREAFAKNAHLTVANSKFVS